MGDFIKMLDDAYAAEADGQSVIRTFEADEAIVAGDVVCYVVSLDGTTGVPDQPLTHVDKADGILRIFAGVALTAATAAGDKIQVVTKGYVPTVNCGAATAAGSKLTVYDGTTAGRAGVCVASGSTPSNSEFEHVWGQALAADGNGSSYATNYAPAWIY